MISLLKMESKATRKQIQDRVRQMLESSYPPDEGWEFNFEAKWKDYKIDFVVERREGNRRFRNIIKISYSCSPLDRSARTLNKAARKMAGRYVKIVEKILYSHGSAEFGSPDESIQVHRIEDLICQDNKLYWGK